MTTKATTNRATVQGGGGRALHAGLFLLVLFTIAAGCKKNPPPPKQSYRQVNLVADTAGYGAMRTDPALVNAWGIALSPSGIVWIAANHTGLSTIYDRTGATVLQPVTIPGADAHMPGAPTGVVFNGTPNFTIPANHQKARFIFAGEDGIISAWSSGGAAIKVADRSGEDAVYKGLALANDGAANFIYAADFRNGKIDVWDSTFQYVTGKPFWDPSIPSGFAPFNIQAVGDKLYVTYAKQDADKEDDVPGPGNGYVDIYNPDGSLVKRFASGGALNSPWGVTAAPDGFASVHDAILIGNFGDGWINVYDAHGTHKGALKDKWGHPIAIEGLWAITFMPATAMGADPMQLFFTAGPHDEEHGLFGYVQPR